MFHLNKQLKKNRAVKLSNHSKELIRETLLSHIQEHPVRNIESSRLLFQNHLSYFAKSFIIRPSYSMPFIILALVAMLGGGTAFAAQGSLPGDLLYPVKVNVNEELQSAFTFNEEAKANLELNHAEERVNEAIRSEAKGKLSDETKLTIEDQIARHTEQINEIAKKLEVRGNVQAAEAVRSHLDGYIEIKSKILEKIGMPILSGQTTATIENSEKIQADTSPEKKEETKNSLERNVIHEAIKAVQKENKNLLNVLKREDSDDNDSLIVQPIPQGGLQPVPLINKPLQRGDDDTSQENENEQEDEQEDEREDNDVEVEGELKLDSKIEIEID